MWGMKHFLLMIAVMVGQSVLAADNSGALQPEVVKAMRAVHSGFKKQLRTNTQNWVDHCWLRPVRAIGLVWSETGLVGNRSGRYHWPGPAGTCRE